MLLPVRVQFIAMTSSTAWTAVLCTIFLLGCPSLLRAELSAMGSWEFDEERREIYVNSVKATQRGGAMSEIAAEMGMARIENSFLTFGVDSRGPHLIRTDKTTGVAERKPVTIRRDGADLILTEEDTGAILRLQPIDGDHLTMVDEARKLIVPLKRR